MNKNHTVLIYRILKMHGKKVIIECNSPTTDEQGEIIRDNNFRPIKEVEEHETKCLINYQQFYEQSDSNIGKAFTKKGNSVFLNKDAQYLKRKNKVVYIDEETQLKTVYEIKDVYPQGIYIEVMLV